MFQASADQLLRQADMLRNNGRLAEAAAICRSSLYSYPRDVRILNLIAILDLQQGMNRDSLGWMERSLALDPRQPEVLSNYASVLERVGRLAEALAAVDKALALQPDYAEAYSNRGNFLNLLGRPQEGLAACNRALELGAHSVAVYVNRGNALRALMRFEEALADFDVARKLAPDMPLVLNNRGHVLKDLGRADEALADFDRVTALCPYVPDGHVGRGNALRDLRRYDAAKAAYDQALLLNPEEASAKWNKAQLCLLTEDFENGWPLFESRWQGAEALRHAARHLPQPQWHGEDLAGKSIFVYGEQGLGDTVQFCRYIPLLEARGAKVFFEVPAALKSLIATMAGHFQLRIVGESVPETDYQCPLMSLPLAFKTNLGSIPGKTPYLAADAENAAGWAEKLGPKTKPRIGLCWSGRSGQGADYNRSMAAKYLAPLMDLQVAFHCLQKDIREADCAVIADLPIATHAGTLSDFSDTAALMAQMDLVLSVDTSVAHVAGALGRPVWLMLPYNGEWRWLSGRADSPWYPSMTIFRQPEWGDWCGLIATVKARWLAG